MTPIEPPRPPKKEKWKPDPWKGLKWDWRDSDPAIPPSPFRPGRAAERHFARQMKGVAGQIAAILKGAGSPEIQISLLRQYGLALGGWASAAAENMLAGVAKATWRAWAHRSSRIGEALQSQMNTRLSSQSANLKTMIEASASAIRTLPDNIADKIPDLVANAYASGERAEALADKIQGLGDIARSDALRIARTEVSRAQTGYLKMTSLAAGRRGYIWHTSEDGDVRPEHAAMNGQYVFWDEPPSIGGRPCHAGEDYNCRCWAEPIPDDDPRAQRAIAEREGKTAISSKALF